MSKSCSGGTWVTYTMLSANVLWLICVFINIAFIWFRALFSCFVQNLIIHLDSHSIKLLTVELLWINVCDKHKCGKWLIEPTTDTVHRKSFSSQNVLQLDGLKEVSELKSLSCQDWIHSNKISIRRELYAQWATTLSFPLSFFIPSEETWNLNLSVRSETFLHLLLKCPRLDMEESQ